MTATLPEDCDFFRRIHGTFRTPARDRFAFRTYAVVFALGVPFLCFSALFCSGFPQLPLTKDLWTGVVLTISSAVLGLLFWVHADREWIFTGDEILAYRRSKLIWRVPIDSITASSVEQASYNILWLHLRVDRQRYSILLVPDFLEQIRRS